MNNEFLLNNGRSIPSIAFGTWRLPDTPQTALAVREAIQQGYRHIDTAAKYGNEAAVGEGIRTCGIPREALFVTTKLRNTERGYDSTLRDFDRALTTMGLDYIDLYMIHWPAPANFYENWKEINAQTWKAMERLQEEGVVKSLGVSNFTRHYLEALKCSCHIFPAVNQISLHPGIYPEQEALIHYCQWEHLVVSAYSPLGAGSVLQSELISTIAEGHEKSSAQVCLRWCLQHEIIPLPKSSSAERMRQNLDIYNFTLSEEEMGLLDTMPNFGAPVRNPDETNFD